MKYLALIIFVVAAAAAPAFAQQVNGRSTTSIPQEPGTLTGIITDVQGAVVPGVRIEAKDRKGKIFETNANSDGLYTLALPSGRYRVSFKSQGFPFTSMSIDDYQMPYSLTMHLDMSLPCDDPCKVVY